MKSFEQIMEGFMVERKKALKAEGYSVECSHGDKIRSHAELSADATGVSDAELAAQGLSSRMKLETK